MGRRRHVVLMGPPGAGKGTQAARLAAEEGLCRISTGDLLRSAVQAGSELGRVAEGYMTRGELVPDELMLDLVAEELDRPACAAGAVDDGFPRTIEQARALDRDRPVWRPRRGCVGSRPVTSCARRSRRGASWDVWPRAT